MNTPTLCLACKGINEATEHISLLSLGCDATLDLCFDCLLDAPGFPGYQGWTDAMKEQRTALLHNPTNVYERVS